MSTDGQGTQCRRNIAENLNRLSRAHERTDDRQTDRQTDRRQQISNTTFPAFLANVTFAKMLEKVVFTYNDVCIIIDQGLENMETFSSTPRPRLFLQDQDDFSCPQGASRTKPRY